MNLKRTVIIYLALCAVSEALLLLFASGVADQNLNWWKFQLPERMLPAATEVSPVVGRLGLMIPAALLVIIVLMCRAGTDSPRLGIHALGISLIVTVLICLWTVSASLLPAVGGTIQGDPERNLPRKARD